MNPVVLPELRYRRLWMLLGFGMAAAVATLSLLPSRDLPNLHLSDKIEHIVSYVLLAFWFGSIVVRRDFLWLIIALLAFGGVIELAQGWMGLGREADWFDLGADAVGIALGLVIALSPLGRWARGIEALFGKARA